MTRILLILSQICALALPAGVCTCERTGSATKQETKSCACCRQNCADNCPLTKESPTPSRNQPCREPSCPANPSFVRAIPGLPLESPAVVPPMTVVGSIVESNPPNSQFAGQRPADAVLLPTAYLFLIYGTLLI
jgi:hypothetical protein